MPGAYSVLRLEPSILSCLNCLFPYPSQLWSRACLYHVPGVSPLTLGYSTSCLLDACLPTSEKIYLKEERGQRFLLWNISTSHLPLLFSTQESHPKPQNASELCLKPLVNSVWKMSRKFRKGRANDHDRWGMHLEFLTLEPLQRRAPCFDGGSQSWDLLCSAQSPYL